MSCASQKFALVVPQIATGPLGKSGSVFTSLSVEAVGATWSVAELLFRARFFADLDWRDLDGPRFSEVGAAIEGVLDVEGVTKPVAVAKTGGVGGTGGGVGGTGGGAGGSDGVPGMEGVVEAGSEPMSLSVGKNSLIPACLDMVAR